MKKKIIGYALIVITFLCVGAYVFWSAAKIDNLTIANEKYKNTKDCTMHERIIDNLKKENMSLINKLTAAESTTDDAINDAEYFLKSYYNRKNTTGADVIAKITPLVSETVLNYYKQSLGNAGGGIDYEMQIENMQSFSRKKSTNIAEVYCVFDCVFTVGQTTTKSTICFNANMTFKQKWIVDDVIRHQTVKYIRGF